MSKTLPPAAPPATPQPLYQQTGMRWSRALPYELGVDARIGKEGRVRLQFINTGAQGAVFHVYDKLHLDRIPRRYTVETDKTLSDDAWGTHITDNGMHDLWVCSTNGFLRTFKGQVAGFQRARSEVRVRFHPRRMEIEAAISNDGTHPARVTVVANAYRLRHHDHGKSFVVAPHRTIERTWSLDFTGGWYDFTVTADGFERRFAGRMETGQDRVSDPAMGMTATEDSVMSESVEPAMATTEPQAG